MLANVFNYTYKYRLLSHHSIDEHSNVVYELVMLINIMNSMRKMWHGQPGLNTHDDDFYIGMTIGIFNVMESRH